MTSESLNLSDAPAGSSHRSGLRRDPVVLVTGAVIALLVILAVFAPLIAPDDPNFANILATNLGPSSSHLLGT
ncbi:MAG: ABC transporter permease, partial [Acidobacteriota bacterium]|nr:ABC transporter permease [Acidobacteriota bacterium]